MRIPQNCNTGEFGSDFFEQLQALANQRRLNAAEPGDVTPGPREAVNQPSPNRISHIIENNWDRPRCILQSDGLRRPASDDQVEFEPDQLIGQSGKPVEPIVSGSIVEN